MAVPIEPHAPLSKYRSAWITLRCRGCRHVREMAAEALARLIGWEARPVEMAHRFRCRHCALRTPDVYVGWESKPRGWNDLRR